MGIKFNSCVLVLVTWWQVIPYTSSKSMSINEYFPEIHRDISKVSFAHAVNSHEKLQEALEDNAIMMLEADILIGTHEHFEDMQPIMAHPPSKSSDLTFTQFLDIVLKATTSGGKRKGIKLDFKEIEAVEPCLKELKSRVEGPDSLSIPIFINADILAGPVNATKKPMNPEKFITLAKQYTPFAVLSVGWTTLYGYDNSDSDPIREGKYSRQQIKAMHKIIRTHAGDPPVFPHVTFPVRASLSAQSVEEMFYLTSRMRGESSITLWSPATDNVNRTALRRLVQQMPRQCFIDLPFPIDENHALDDSQDQQVNEGHLQHLEGRGELEEESAVTNGASATSFLSFNTLLPVIAMGLITSAIIAYRRL